MKKRTYKISLFISIGAITLLIANNFIVQQSIQVQQKNNLQVALTRALLQCYTLEGFYPDQVAYLEEEYGVVINHKKYEIYYEVVGSNIMPNIQVLRRER